MRGCFLGHCYPYCPQPDRTVGITAHTDPRIITVLLQNHVAGLQVWHGNEWSDVKPVPGGLIINVGDLLQVYSFCVVCLRLQIISNGEYKSVQHRVLANSRKEARMSVVISFNLAKWREYGYCGLLPELLSPKKPPVCRDFTAQEYLENYYSKGIDTKSLIEKITIKNCDIHLFLKDIIYILLVLKLLQLQLIQVSSFPIYEISVQDHIIMNWYT